VAYFDDKGDQVVGVDNNMRADFFGPDGDTTWNLSQLQMHHPRFRHIEADIRDRAGMLALFEQERPDAIVHCAAQPSHDLAASRPFDELRRQRQRHAESARGDPPVRPGVAVRLHEHEQGLRRRPNELELDELENPLGLLPAEDWPGIGESMRIDQSKHSIFGSSKVAADVMVQEYGRYFGMNTVCFRGGCLTGPNHSGAELHGFLSYLVKATVTRRHFRIFDTRESRFEIRFTAAMSWRRSTPSFQRRGQGVVYNLGGGPRQQRNRCSSPIELVEERVGESLELRVTSPRTARVITSVTSAISAASGATTRGGRSRHRWVHHRRGGRKPNDRRWLRTETGGGTVKSGAAKPIVRTMPGRAGDVASRFTGRERPVSAR